MPSSDGSPLVAVTTEAAEAAGRHGKPQVQLYGAYLARLTEAGLTPLLITPFHDEAAVGEIVGMCSGLVLTGGEDVAPQRYGEDVLGDLVFVTPERDAAEWAALAAAYRMALPVLAICRGIQVLNVYHGGTLWQDIPSQRPGGVAHEQTQAYGEAAHAVSVRAGSLLHGIVGADGVRVNSYHHQAPKDIAPGLAVTATSEDGVIEGLEPTDGSWVVAVQWHPERLPEDAAPDHPDRRLFNAFADAVRRRNGS